MLTQRGGTGAVQGTPCCFQKSPEHQGHQHQLAPSVAGRTPCVGKCLAVLDHRAMGCVVHSWPFGLPPILPCKSHVSVMICPMLLASASPGLNLWNSRPATFTVNC